MLYCHNGVISFVSVTVTDNNSCFVHLLRCIYDDDNSCSNDCFLSGSMLALRCMPRKVSEVGGPSTLGGLMGAL